MIPDEDLAAVQERIEAFQADLKPRNDVAGFLATRAAALSVRLDRCVRQEAAKITRDMMEADADEAEVRLADLEFYIAKIELEPAKAVRNLRRSPEGIDWLIGAWRLMLVHLFDPASPRFSFARAWRLYGGPDSGFDESRMGAVERATIEGGQRDARSREWPPPLAPERLLAVRGELKQLVEVEIARLEGLREGLDHGAIARDRAGAQARAIFDPSHEATLARKYEAAAERAFHKTLQQIERINAQVDAEEEAVATGETVEDCGELASSLPDEGGEEPKPIARRSRGPQAAPSHPKSERSRREDGIGSVSSGETAGSARSNESSGMLTSS